MLCRPLFDSYEWVIHEKSYSNISQKEAECRLDQQACLGHPDLFSVFSLPFVMFALRIARSGGYLIESLAMDSGSIPAKGSCTYVSVSRSYYSKPSLTGSNGGKSHLD
jgi:hypothetical protein